MIRPLRRRHRRTIVVLSGLVPLLFVAGLLARRPIPRMGSVPGGTPSGPTPGTIVVLQSDDAWSGAAIRTTWLRDDETSRPIVRLEILEELKRPDLLVYWSAANDDTALPGDAILLGAIAGGGTGAWPLPAGNAAGGVLLLYSLADAEIVGAAEIPAEIRTAPETGR